MILMYFRPTSTVWDLMLASALVKMAQARWHWRIWQCSAAFPHPLSSTPRTLCLLSVPVSLLPTLLVSASFVLLAQEQLLSMTMIISLKLVICKTSLGLI